MDKKNIFYAVLFFIIMTFYNNVCTADDLTPKDEWLKQMKELGPNVICTALVNKNSSNQQLKAHNIDYAKCLTLIPDILDGCVNKLYANIPSKLDKAAADKWGNELGKCVGADFLLKYLSN